MNVNARHLGESAHASSHAATVAGWRTFRSKSQPKTDSPALSVQSRLGGGLRTAFRMRRMASWTSGEKGRARSVTVTFARAHAESAAHVAAPSVAAAPTRPASRCATMRGARPPSGPPMAARGVENPKRRARSRLKPTTHDDIVGTEGKVGATAPPSAAAAAGCRAKMSAMSEAPRTGAARGAARVFTAAGTATAAPARKAATTPATLSRDAAAPRSTTTARAYPAAAAARTTSDHAPKIARSPRPASSSGQTATLARPSSCSRAAAAAAAPSSTITTS